MFLRNGEACPDCGHVYHDAGAHPHHAFIDHSIDREPGSATGEPMAAGEACKCPCHNNL